MRRRIAYSAILALAFVMFMIILMPTVKPQAAAKLPNKLYKVVKGKRYRANNSEMVPDAKFTRTKLIKYYPGSNKVYGVYKLKSVKKLKNGFHGLDYYRNQYKLTYKVPGKWYTIYYISRGDVPLGMRFDYFEDFKDGLVHNSGMAGLRRIG